MKEHWNGSVTEDALQPAFLRRDTLAFFRDHNEAIFGGSGFSLNILFLAGQS